MRIIEVMVRREVDRADASASHLVNRDCEKKNEVNVIAIAAEMKFKHAVMIEQVNNDGIYLFMLIIFLLALARSIVANARLSMMNQLT